MNIENLEEANRIADRLKQNNDSVFAITKILEKYPDGNSDGTSTCCKKIYSMHISEHNDGSGFSINLIGSLIQTELLEATKLLLLKQIETDTQRIKEL